MQGKASITCTILSRFMRSGLVHAMRSNGPHYKYICPGGGIEPIALDPSVPWGGPSIVVLLCPQVTARWWVSTSGGHKNFKLQHALPMCILISDMPFLGRIRGPLNTNTQLQPSISVHTKIASTCPVTTRLDDDSNRR